LLVEQFFTAESYAHYLNENFICLLAMRSEAADDDNNPATALFERYRVRGTPTVLIAQADGFEIDRVIGYEPPAEDFKIKMEEAYRRDDTYLNLMRRSEREPDNVEVNARLARKHQARYYYAALAQCREKILAQPDKARSILLPFGAGGAEVSAYEYAEFTRVFDAPKAVSAFLKKYPQSVMKSSALAALQRFSYQENKRKEVPQVYEQLLKRDSMNAALLSPYLHLCGSMDTHVDRALKHAQAYVKAHPQESDEGFAQAYAELLLKDGKVKEAVAAYGDRFARRHEEAQDAGSLNEYAWFWAERGQNLESALAAAKKSIELSNQHFVWDTLSMILWKMGKHDEAIKAEEEALKLAGRKIVEYEERIAEIKADINQ
jgi:ribosomal 50S subunit-associated protein YjgA (DUF615 family)